MKKTQDCAFVKGELCCQHTKEGTARQRLKRQFGSKGTVPLDVDPTGSQLEEEEFLKEIENLNIMESEDSDNLNESDGLPESILEHNPSQSDPSHVLQVAQQLMQAVDDDSDESDVGEEPVVAPTIAGTSKVTSNVLLTYHSSLTTHIS